MEKLFHLGADQIGHGQGVGARLQEYAKTDVGLAIKCGGRIVVARAKFDASDVLQAQYAPGAARTQNDVLEFLRLGQPAPRGDGVDQGLALRRRLLTSRR